MLPETFAADACFSNVPSFATRETMFPEAVKHKNILLLETMFPMQQNWETLGKHVSASNVSGNMFRRFARALGNRNSLQAGQSVTHTSAIYQVLYYAN